MHTFPQGRWATPAHVRSTATLPLDIQAKELRHKIAALKLCSGNDTKIAERERELADLEARIGQTNPPLLKP
jgi:hypothetical protein